MLRVSGGVLSIVRVGRRRTSRAHVLSSGGVRRETGMEWRVKELHRDGSATHPGPESCGDVREGGAEALTGERTGRVLSREINPVGVPTLYHHAEGNAGRCDIAIAVQTSRGRIPMHVCKLRAREPGCLAVTRRGWTDGPQEEGRKAEHS